MNSLEEEVQDERQHRCTANDTLEVGERCTHTCFREALQDFFLFVWCVCCVCVDICLCVSPDGNDCRAEWGHMVMWHDSGPDVHMSKLWFTTSRSGDTAPRNLLWKPFCVCRSRGHFHACVASFAHRNKKHDSLSDFFISSPHLYNVKASVTSSNNVGLWGCNVSEESRGQWSRGGVANLPAKGKCV